MIGVRVRYPCQRCKKEMARIEQDAARRKYCKKCFQESVAEKKETFYCDICGDEVTRRKKDKQFRFKCCSRACQQKSRHLTKREINKDTIELRIAQKAIQADDKSKRRNEECAIRPYWRAWVLVTQKVEARDEYRKDAWLTKILTRLVQKRPSRVLRKSSKTKAKGWYWSIRDAICQIGNKTKYYQYCPWKKKIQNKLSNASKRMRVKNENKKANGTGNQREAGIKWIQMRFDWMET